MDGTPVVVCLCCCAANLLGQSIVNLQVGALMVSLDVLRSQLVETLERLEVALQNPVPAEEVFYVQDYLNYAHLAGLCRLGWSLPMGSTWETGTVSSLESLPKVCGCWSLPTEDVKQYIDRVRDALYGLVNYELFWVVNPFVTPLSRFPQLFEVWQQAHRQFLELALVDPFLLGERAAYDGLPVADLPRAGLCTVRMIFWDELEFFPNGKRAGFPSLMLPEVAITTVSQNPEEWVISSVDGWPADRVEMLNVFLRDDMDSSLDAFNLSMQLVQ